jgi:manganese oxidase
VSVRAARDPHRIVTIISTLSTICDIVIDFSNYAIGDRLHLVNLAEHQDGRKPADDLTVAEALSGKSEDPCVGRFLDATRRSPTRAASRTR